MILQLNNQQEWWRIWDFFSHHPECMHMFTWLLDDVGIPRDYRHMDGFGVHTFTWINNNNNNVLVKYHWITQQGESKDYFLNELTPSQVLNLCGMRQRLKKLHTLTTNMLQKIYTTPLQPVNSQNGNCLFKSWTLQSLIRWAIISQHNSTHIHLTHTYTH